MRLNILIGGKAGQGINKVSEIISNTISSYGYWTFNYRDYQSLIRGGHNFNVLCISDEPTESFDSQPDILVCLDELTKKNHSAKLKKEGTTLSFENFLEEKRNLNIALSGAVIKILGIPLEELNKELTKQFNSKEILASAKKGFDSTNTKYSLQKLKNKKVILSGSEAIATGARKSGLNLYIAYPMTPATNAMHELAKNEIKDNILVFQAENEISVASMALGASFAGAKTLVGTSGGGLDLMGESLSMQGISQIPLTVYLASRPGPGTGVPTYTSQSDLDIALRSGHGEFPRVVVAPSNAIETIEKTSEALYLAEKFNNLSIILSDKHVAESEFSFNQNFKTLKTKVKRKIPGKDLVKASSYEIDKFGNSTEDENLTIKNVIARIKKYENIKKFIEKNFEMIKIHGKENSKNLILGWGSSTGAIKDAIKDLDAKFLQIIYVKPLSQKIKEEMSKAKNIILVEQNVTGQLGRLLREKTGIKVPEENRILKFDGRPFTCDKLKEEIRERLK